MTKFGFQLYSLHEVDDPLPTVIERVGETGFEGVELAYFGDADLGDVSAALNAEDLGVAGVHVDLEEIEADAAAVAETYAGLGCDDVVVPWLDPEHFESESAVEAAGERLDAAADELADHGLSLHYHNHDQEFVELGDEPALSHLMAVTESVGFELDLGWIGSAGYDPLPYLDAHADKVKLVHLKDYDAETGELVEVGEGDIDIEATIEAVRDHGFEWLVYEAEERPDSYATLDHAAEIADTYW